MIIPALQIPSFAEVYQKAQARQMNQEYLRRNMELAAQKQQMLMDEMQREQDMRNELSQLYSDVQTANQQRQAAQAAAPALQDMFQAQMPFGIQTPPVTEIPQKRGFLTEMPGVVMKYKPMQGAKLLADKGVQVSDAANPYRAMLDKVPADVKSRLLADRSFWGKAFPDIEYVEQETQLPSSPDQAYKQAVWKQAGGDPFQYQSLLNQFSRSGVPTPVTSDKSPTAKMRDDMMMQDRYRQATGKNPSDDWGKYYDWMGDIAFRKSGGGIHSKNRNERKKREEAIRTNKNVYNAMMDFEKEELTKDYKRTTAAVPQLESMVNEAKRAIESGDTGTAAATSIAVLFSFIKSLDNSVVRASEIAAFDSMNSWAGRFQQMLQTPGKGGLTPSKLDGVINTIKAKLRGLRGAYDRSAAMKQNQLRGIYGNSWEDSDYKAAAPMSFEILPDYTPVTIPRGMAPKPKGKETILYSEPKVQTPTPMDNDRNVQPTIEPGTPSTTNLWGDF